MDADCVEVRELKDGYKTLVAKEDMQKGTFLGDLWGTILPSPTTYTHQIGIDKHIAHVGNHRFRNHSCSPNAKSVYSQREGAPAHVKDGQVVAWHIVAARDISKGEEITNDYTLTEYAVASPFTCRCGSENCLGIVRGFKYLPPEEKEKRMCDVSPVIKELTKME
jgi:hypothetical protein